nr:cytochrome P450 81E8-like [Tanacetum cinerariifolium]
MHYNFASMSSALYDHLWRSLRRVTAAELFSTTRLSSTIYAREHEVKLMCAHIYKVSSQKVELKSIFHDLLNNITTMSMIGKRYHGDVIDSGDGQSAPRADKNSEPDEELLLDSDLTRESLSQPGMGTGIQVAQKKVKIAFENADSSSRVELIPSKIKYAIKVVLSFHNEFSEFSSLSRKENDGLLQDQVFKNKVEVVINVT